MKLEYPMLNVHTMSSNGFEIRIQSGNRGKGKGKKGKGKGRKG